MIRRNTIQRSLVLEAVADFHGHPTAEEVYSELNVKYPDISKATVYRNLNVLCEDGELFKLSMPNEADRFDYAEHGHSHLKCLVCGKVEDLHLTYIDNIREVLKKETGYEIDMNKMVFEGICPECKKND